ncbi:MAG: hypothetical protein HYZ27_03360 [Deltaproteobacteria bacterium]|nr:hypothetical protein [Deltaproteobacteria bacterium]
MDRLTAKKVRYFVKLQYPVFITVSETGFKGALPDLPGCECTCRELSEVYVALERMRRDFIAQKLSSGAGVPLPNSRGLLAEAAEPAHAAA